MSNRQAGVKDWLAVALLILAVVSGSCGESGARSAAPSVDDAWVPPAGVDLDSVQLYRENRYLFDYDAEVPLDVQQIRSARTGDITSYELTYASPKGGRVPATLFVPDGDGPFGGLVLMHGLPGDRTGMSDYAIGFAQLDAVVITIDAPFSRLQHAGEEPLSFSERDHDEQIQLIVDLRRAVDLLVSRSEVDSDRMGYVGISYGGAMGGLLAGVEDRLQGYVLQVGDGGLVTHFTGPEDTGGYIYTGLSESGRESWLKLMWPIEPIHYVGHASPAALLFQNGSLDESVPPADALRYQEAGSEPKTVWWYDGGHGVSSAAAKDAVEWLQDHEVLGQLRPGAPANRVDQGILVWSVLVVGSFVSLLAMLWRDQATPLGAALLWGMAVFFFGPLGLAAYGYLYRRPMRSSDPAFALGAGAQALGSTMWSAAGSLVGVFVIVVSNSYEPWLVVLLPLATGFLTYQLSRLPRRQNQPWVSHGQPVTVQILSTNMILLGAYVLLPFALERWFDQWYPFDEPLRAVWAILVVASFAGILTGYPVHRWMVGRGLLRWGPNAEPIEPKRRRVSRIRALGLILVSFVVLITVVQLAVDAVS